VDRQRTHTWYVTRSLFLGDPPALTGAAKVADPAQAADVVRAGGIAVLPAGSWDMADEVLWLLDFSPGWREHLLHWARTGQSGGRCRRKSTQPSQLPAARRLRQAKGHGLIRPMGRRLDRGRCWPRSWPPSSRWMASDTGPWCDLLRAPPLEGCTLMTHSDAPSTKPLPRTRCSTTCWQSDYAHLPSAHGHHEADEGG